MKKLYLFTLGLIVGAVPTALAASMAFSDVAENAWYYDAVSNLYDRGTVEGYDDDTFRPGNTVNRAELAVMMEREMNFNLAYDLAHALVVWANQESPAQEITINGIQIIGSTANAGGYSDATIKEENLPVFAEMLEGQSLRQISYCQEALETRLASIEFACDFLGEIELSDTEFGDM